MGKKLKEEVKIRFLKDDDDLKKGLEIFIDKDKVQPYLDKGIVEIIDVEREQEARYLQDKATLDQNQGRDGLFQPIDLIKLNIFPENYKKWYKEYRRLKDIKEVKQYIETWVRNWDRDRIECLSEIKDIAGKYDYTFTDLKGLVLNKIKEKLKEEYNESEEDIGKNLMTHELKGQYLELIKDKKWNEGSELLVKYIKKDMSIYTTKEDIKSEMWVYYDGIYKPEGRSHIKEWLRKILGNWYSTFTYNNVIAKLEPDTFIDSKKFFSTNYKYEIPLINGILNIKTKELKPFNPQQIFFSKLPVIYDPKNKCEKIDKFVSDVLSNEDDKHIFYEIGGFCLLKEYTFEKAFMFVGEGRNGKSKLLELLKRVIGFDNCYSLSLSALDFNNADVHQLFGKMVNLAGDIGSNDLKHTALFKALTGRDPVTVKRKFLTSLTFENYAKFIFACNELPMVYDNSKGFWDRWILLDFPYYFADKHEFENNKSNDEKNWKLRDEEIIQKIISPDELSGLLNKFLEGFDRLFKNRKFSTTKGSEETKKEWVRRSNSFISFCMEHIEHDYDSCIQKKDLRKKYINYCKEHKVLIKSDFVIKKVLQEYYGVSEEREQILNKVERVWSGITFKNKTDKREMKNE